MRPPNPQLMGLLTPYDSGVVELLMALREVVLDEAPEATEMIWEVSYTIALWYSFTGRQKGSFCYITVYASHVNLGFPYGTELPDPRRLLEGSGKKHRHVSVHRLADLARPQLRSLLQSALERAERRNAPARPVSVMMSGPASSPKRSKARK